MELISAKQAKFIFLFKKEVQNQIWDCKIETFAYKYFLKFPDELNCISNKKCKKNSYFLLNGTTNFPI